MSSPAPRGRSAAALVLLTCSLIPSRIAAQEDCDFIAPTRSMQFTTLTGGATITYLGAPHMMCRDGIEIWADSAVEYSAQSMQHMMGSVRFIDANGELNADEARYFPEQGRLQANGHVFVQDTLQGFTIRNGNLVYLRATDFREEPQTTVTIAADGIQPHAILRMRPAEPRPESIEPTAPDTIAADSTGTALSAEALVLPVDAGPHRQGSPYIVDGNRIFIQGDRYFRATGDVEIERDSLNAFADSVEYDQVAGRILLEGSARVDGPTYDLVARTITLGMDGDDIDEVRAVRDAVLNGNEVVLTAPEIRIYLLDDLLDRLVAVMAPAPPDVMLVDSADARPVAQADDFEVTADSIEVIAPGEALERIFAGGMARSVSRARDSLNVETLPEIARTDWLEGDTVIVMFVPADTSESLGPAADTAQAAYRIDRIIAQGDARSLYRLPPSDTAAVLGEDEPAVHYVVGDEITIVMVEGDVDRMEVDGHTRGMHLEPVRVMEDSLAAPSLGVDTTTALDTTSVGGSPRGTTPQEPSRPPGSRTPSSDGHPQIRESAATRHPWRGS